MRNSIHWDRELEGGLPDSRLSLARRKTTVMRAGQLMEKVFCANCGADGGLITAEFCPHIFYVCDNCFLKFGPPPLPEVEELSLKGL